MTYTMEIKPIRELPGYKQFRKGKVLLGEYLSELLNCEVEFIETSIDEFVKDTGIDILSNVNRNAYLENETVILSVKILEKKVLKALFPICLRGKTLNMIDTSFYEKLVTTITLSLSTCASKRFEGAEYFMGDYLRERVIYSCFMKSNMDVYRFCFLIECLKKLGLTTFENENFSTGFILTNSAHDYIKNKEHDRNGVVYSLNEKKSLFHQSVHIDRRNWYLADGKTSFFLINENAKPSYLYVAPYDAEISNFWDSYSLKNILYGRDIAFRVINSKQISITDSSGIEFICIEGTWKYRNYNIIRKIIQDKSGLDEEYIDALLYFVIYSAQANKSTIIWLPDILTDELLKDKLVAVKQTLSETIDIGDSRNIEMIKRILSSDGVTVIDGHGGIVNNGCVVNLAKMENTFGLIGTGESAARLLAESGIAIKVSQDGIIKIFYDSKEKPYTF